MRWDQTFWNDARDAQLRQLAAQEKSATEAAVALGTTRNAVLSHAKLLGVRFNSLVAQQRVWTPEMDAQLKTLCAEGLTAQEIADEMGKTRNGVRSHIKYLQKQLQLTATNQHSKQKKRKHVITQEERKELIASVVTTDIVLMEDMRRDQCQYPVTETTPFQFCGKKREHGVYCEAHWAVTHQHATLARL